MKLSDQILATNDAALQDMLTHRFVTDIKTDRLPNDVFHRYLAYEGAFVNTAISIFSYATSRAPDIASQRWLIGVLDALANEQVAYFEKTCAQLEIIQPETLPVAVKAFDSGMHDLAREGSFLDIVTAMFAAEWMYWKWCSDAARYPITDPNLRAWVELHATVEFEAQVRWLKEAIDTFSDASHTERLSMIFDHVIQLEIAFHSAAYETPTT